MSLTLKRKTEKVLIEWIDLAASELLDGYQFYQGLRMAAKSASCVIVAVTALEPSWESGEGGPQQTDGRVDVVLKTKCIHDNNHESDTSEEEHYDAAEFIESRLRNFSGLRAFANADNETNRPVTSFYLADLSAPTASFMFDEKAQCFVTMLQYRFTVNPSDCTDA